MGNRGVIHDPETKKLLTRRWTTRAWIICQCEWKGRRRAVMGRNTPSGNAGWTELFFLDEVTALAAGHRPCFYCRRDAAQAFLAHFRRSTGLIAAKAEKLDRRLHVERLASGGAPEMVTAEQIGDLPEGTMLFANGNVLAIHDNRLRPWSFTGYGTAKEGVEWGQIVQILTPPTTRAILKAGYNPFWHQSL